MQALRVDAAVDATPGAKGRIKDTKTHQSVTLRLDPTTVAELWAHRDRQLAIPDGGFVWTALNDGMTPIRPDRITGLCSAVRSRSSLLSDDVRFHDLRHATATWALDAGHSPRAVSDQLRHSATSTTLDIYVDSVADADGRIVATLAGLLAEPPAGPPRRRV